LQIKFSKKMKIFGGAKGGEKMGKINCNSTMLQLDPMHLFLYQRIFHLYSM